MTDKHEKKIDNNKKQGVDRRRLLLSGAATVGGAAVFAAGYSETLVNITKGLFKGTAGVPTKSATRGNSLKPEMSINKETGALSMEEGYAVSPSMCFGCWTICGVRTRVDLKNNKIVRIAGNPYHPLATTQPADMEDSVRDVYTRLGGESGLEGRATSCARGSSMLENLDNPHRVLQPLKRVGKRGEGKWQTISFEQLIAEVVEGGDLFGEGHVDGLRAVYDHKTLIDPENPDYGPVANQLMCTDGSNEGRRSILQRFVQQAFGSVNIANHGAYCGQSYRIGAAAAMGDFPSMKHGKPDWKNARFGLFIGTAPAQSGNPFQRMGRELAEARSRDENTFEYVVVNPILPASSSRAAQGTNEWVGIEPATDLALVMGMIQWMIKNKRYDAEYLSQPSLAAMKAVGQPSFSNATHLVYADETSDDFGSFVMAETIGLIDPSTADQKNPVYVVVNEDGVLTPSSTDKPAIIDVDKNIIINGQSVPVKSSFALLREHANKKTLEEYSEICNIPVEKIIDLATRFTSYGKKAVANSHGGTMHAAGFYTAYAISMLNTLIGNVSYRGGYMLPEGGFSAFGKGPRYDFSTFDGIKKPGGVALCRHRATPYEKSTEYKRKVASGVSPYPAKAPWYPAAQMISSELVSSAIDGYPYKAKIWINHMANLNYGLNGFHNVFEEKIKDPKNIPLFISIDAFINETSALADYIVPDTITYESFGQAGPWNDVVQKASTVRWPVVTPKVGKDAQGREIELVNFLISAAIKLGLPGFGKNAMKDKDGNYHDVFTKEDLFLRGFANVAYLAPGPVPDATEDDMKLTGVYRHVDSLKSVLSEEEWRKAAFVMTRGGRFAEHGHSWKDGKQVKTYNTALPLWFGPLAKMRHSITGQRFTGCPTYHAPELSDGSSIYDIYPMKEWPLRVFSYKSNIMSAVSIVVKRLRQIHPSNPIVINHEDAAALNIKAGDDIIVETPGGRQHGVAAPRAGIVRGAVGIEHGYGHWGLGASAYEIDGKAIEPDHDAGQGVCLNLLGFADPTRKEITNVWIDSISGAVVRQGLPARIIKA